MVSSKNLLSVESESLLAQLGKNIDLARKRRRLKIAQVCERAGISQQTYQRLKKGDPGVSLGALTNVLSALDLEGALLGLADPHQDEYGAALEKANAPRRVRDRGGDDDTELDADW